MSEIKIDWLPMGSIVKLEGVDVPFMVTGRLQKGQDEARVWEYSGCPFPCGFEDSSKGALFDGDRIEHVLFLGYRDEAELAWCEKLTEARTSADGRAKKSEPAGLRASLDQATTHADGRPGLDA